MSETSTTTPTSIMLDTNVLLDYYLAARPGHNAAQKLVDEAFRRDIPLLCAATSLKDFYYLFCLETKRQANAAADASTADQRDPGAIAALASELAWACVENIRELTTVVSMGPGDTAVASKLRALHEDFEDDFLMATALRCGASHFATGDQTLRKHATLPTMSCAELLILMDL